MVAARDVAASVASPPGAPCRPATEKARRWFGRPSSLLSVGEASGGRLAQELNDAFALVELGLLVRAA